MEKTESGYLFLSPAYVKTTEHNCLGLTLAKENGILKKHGFVFFKRHILEGFLSYIGVF